MSESADITQRFNNAVRAYTPSPPPRQAKLMPIKKALLSFGKRAHHFA
ncbi:MAG: hypothetical protein ACR2FX_01980 [Chthoniobacterales bacterium]